MPAKSILAWIAVAACGLTALAVLFVASLDKQGTFRLGQLTVDPAMVAVLLAPQAITAGLAVWSRSRRVGPVACLLAATVCGPWAVAVLWQDHLAWSRERPGQETMHFGILLALLVLYAGCFLAGLVVVAEWILVRFVWSRTGSDPK